MKWISRQLDITDNMKELAKHLSTVRSQFPLPLANILFQRAVQSPEQAQAFFKPKLTQLHDPMLMKGMEQAVNRILDAKRKKEKILVYGDYDVDGTTAVTLVSLFLDEWGFDYEYYIPDRYKEGYGVSIQGIDYADEIGAKLIITLDCGIKAIRQVEYAQSKGVDVVICDHHLPGATLPPAYAILDPKQQDCPYPFKELTGCGVGFKLLEALHPKLKEQGEPASGEKFHPFVAYVDLVTLSTACDIVPIVGENRVLAHFGLRKLRKIPLPGLRAIMDLENAKQRNWDISDLVFFVGPRVNSAGRLGSAKDAVRVLRGQTNAKKLEEFADQLQLSNEDRKELDQQTTDEALQMIEADPSFPQKSTTVLYDENWHKGVIGIVASRLIETHYRPTILLTKSNGKWVGSARSVQGFDLYSALSACETHIDQFGGHQYAAGLSILEEKLSDFQAAFEQAVAERIQEEQKIPVLFIEHQLNFPEITQSFFRHLQSFAPYGPQNMAPIFMSEKVEVQEASILKEKHIRLKLRQKGVVFEAIGFNLAEKWSQLDQQTGQGAIFLDVVYHLYLNRWKNQSDIRLQLKDIQAA